MGDVNLDSLYTKVMSENMAYQAATLVLYSNIIYHGSSNIFFYYVDRCELWGFIREIKSGISHVKYQFFHAGTTFYTTISVVVTCLTVLL